MIDQRRKRHDWHMFDELLGYEVRRDGDLIELRTVDDPDRVIALVVDEFGQLRGTGPKPRGLR